MLMGSYEVFKNKRLGYIVHNSGFQFGFRGCHRRYLTKYRNLPFYAINESKNKTTNRKNRCSGIVQLNCFWFN